MGDEDNRIVKVVLYYCAGVLVVLIAGFVWLMNLIGA
jgi:hypothetical protein